jgi:hypothetical protein
VDRGLVLTKKLPNQWYLLERLKSALRKVSRSPSWLGWPLRNICAIDDHTICVCRSHNLVLLSSFIINHWIWPQVHVDRIPFTASWCPSPFFDRKYIIFILFWTFLCITEWHIYNKYDQTVFSIHTGLLYYI